MANKGWRERWGPPQKRASPYLRIERDTLFGTLDFEPVQVARGSMGFKRQPLVQDAPHQDLGDPRYLLKIMPQVNGRPRICEPAR